MNNLLWFVQIALAATFLYVGFSNIFGYRTFVTGSHGGPGLLFIGVSRGGASLIGFVEILCAIGMVVPVQLWETCVLPQLAAAGIALLALAACYYHGRRKEHTAPLVALFFLAIFVIVGRMP